MNTEVFVRKVYKDDAYSLRKAMVASAESFSKFLAWGKTVKEWPLKVFKEMVRAEIRLADKYGAYVAICDRQIVGYATFTDAWDKDGLQCLYWVHVDYQRRGIAKQLMEKLIEEAFLIRNIDYLEVHVAEGNYGSHQVAKSFKPFATSAYESPAESDKGYEDNGKYIVYYLVNPRTYAAYKALEIMNGISMPTLFSKRVHSGPGYNDLTLARDLLSAMNTFRTDLNRILK